MKFNAATEDDSMKKWKSTVMAVAVATMMVAGAPGALAASRAMMDPGRVTLVDPATPASDAATPDKVRQAILDGAKVHQWQMIAEQPGVLTLKAGSGGHSATIAVAYDATGYEITYKDSVNFNYKLGDDGKASIHSKYNKWISDLGNDIRAAASADGIH